MEPGAKSVTVYIDNVTTPISSATIKSWDFSSSNGTLGVDIKDPSQNTHDVPGILGFNSTLSGKLNIVCTEKGTYKIVFHVISGNSGGWVGCWLY